MNILTNLTTYTASEAREKLYTLIKSTAKGVRTYEIQLRSGESVVLVNRDEIDAWQETLDILTNPAELKAIRNARKQKKTISHKTLLKTLKLHAA